MNAKRIIREYFRKIGAKGGRAGTGKSKARSSAQAREAVNHRWAKVRQARDSGVKAKQQAGAA